MIPKTVWMTHEDKYENLPSYIHDTFQTWKDLNPDYNFIYFDSEQRKNFVLNEYGKEWLQRYNKSTSGVMQADIWRYLIVYKYGGIYTDIDYQCNKPISFWCKSGMDMIISVDEKPDELICSHFAATERHPLLKSIIETVYNNLDEIDFSIRLIPYTLTGPTAFTNGVKTFLNIEDSLDLFNNVEIINNNEKAKKYKIFCYGNKNRKMFHGVAVTHLDGRINWYDGKHDWLKVEQERYNKYIKEKSIKNIIGEKNE